MRKFSVAIMIIAAFTAFYQQNSPEPNIYITLVAIAIFMFGMMKLSAKIPPKDNEDDHPTV